METISLSGAWKLRPLEREECSACTSYFEENEFLSYNNSNSIYTTLSTVVSKDELEKLRKLKWVIEREFEFEEDTDQRSVLLAKGALSAAINGTVIDKSEITELLKNGKNTIRLCVTSSFFSEIEILRSHDGIGYSAHLRAKEEGDFWHVSAALDYEAFRKHSRVVRISLLGCEREETVTFEEKRNRYTIDIEIPKEKVELWCLRGDGKQIMYTAKITVGNAVLERMIAFRKVEIKDGALYFNGRETFDGSVGEGRQQPESISGREEDFRSARESRENGDERRHAEQNAVRGAGTRHADRAGATDVNVRSVLEEGVTYDGTNFFFAVKPQLDEMFVRYPAEDRLNAIVPNSKWVRVDTDEGDYYVLGVLYDLSTPIFICYGIPGMRNVAPPREIADVCVWLPLSADEPDGGGFWIIYQSAENGKCVR